MLSSEAVVRTGIDSIQGFKKKKPFPSSLYLYADSSLESYKNKYDTKINKTNAKGLMNSIIPVVLFLSDINIH